MNSPRNDQTTRIAASGIKRLLTPPLIVVAALVMWIEEILWKRLKDLTSLIGLIPLVHRVETVIARLPPYAAMLVLITPATILFPLKLLAVYWLARGYWFASFALLAAAKVLGTAFVARMYVICQPQLLTIAWFRQLRDIVVTARARLYEAVRKLSVYQAAHRMLATIRSAARSLLSRLSSRRQLWQRWRAILRWRRQNSQR